MLYIIDLATNRILNYGHWYSYNLQYFLYNGLQHMRFPAAFLFYFFVAIKKFEANSRMFPKIHFSSAI